MPAKQAILNVLYQSDDNYAMVSSISIVSLLENNKHLDKIHVYYCAYNVTRESKDKLRKMIRAYRNATLVFLDGEEYHNILLNLGVKPWHGVYVTWLKLLAFGSVRLDTDRILFINGHSIVNGPLDELITLDFEDNVMALSYDCLINDHKKAIGLRETDGYYNCGIMLINHKKWMTEHIEDQVLSHLQKKSDYQIADQDLCNVLFKKKIKTLGVTYNFSSAYYAYDLRRLLKINNLQPDYFYSYEQIMENYYDPKIIHSLFGIKGKPWEEDNDHPQRFLWNKYLRLTPWADEPRKAAVRTMNWRLYKMLPSPVFMMLYQWGVRSKFGK